MSDWPRVAFMAGTLGQGGAERQLFEQCSVLRDAGAVPVVLSLTRGEFWEAPLVESGIEVVWVGSAPGRVRRLAAVVGELRRRKVDVVQASHGMTNLYAVAAGRILRLPAVGALRTTPDRVVSELGWLGRPALRAPQRLVGNSRSNLQAASGFGVRADRLCFVPNAVDINRFVPSWSETKSGGTGVVGSDVGAATGELVEPEFEVVFVGRLGPEKRVATLLEAVNLLRAGGTRIRVAVVGSGRLEDDLRTIAADLGIDDRVTFVGRDPEPERWLEKARVLALPSEREGTPNVVLEAMACGLPVVATPVGSVPELVEDGQTGWLVPVGDAVALASALERVLDDPAAARAMGEAGRRRVETGFDRGAVRAAMAELYRELGGARWPCAA